MSPTHFEKFVSCNLAVLLYWLLKRKRNIRQLALIVSSSSFTTIQLLTNEALDMM